MKKNNDVACLKEHTFTEKDSNREYRIPCGLAPNCPFTTDFDVVEKVSVSEVSTNELFELVATDESAHDGDFSKSFIGSEEFEDCRWIVYQSESGGVAVELIKDETHLESIIAVESWLAEAIRDLNIKLDERYYTGENSYWYDEIATEEQKEEIQNSINNSISEQKVDETFSDI